MFCRAGQTTVNGVEAVPGSLIFSDDFDKLDFTVWQHEKTMSGGGVRFLTQFNITLI